MLRIFYNTLQSLCGFSGAKIITHRSPLLLHPLSQIPASPINVQEHSSTSTVSFFPKIPKRLFPSPPHTPLTSSPREISLLRKIMAHLLGGLSASPNVFIRLHLSTLAMDILLRNTKDPVFKETWERALNRDWLLALAICICYLLSFLAIAPFNYYNTYKAILSSTSRDTDKRDKILKTIDNLDTGLSPILTLLFGSAVGSIKIM